MKALNIAVGFGNRLTCFMCRYRNLFDSSGPSLTNIYEGMGPQLMMLVVLYAKWKLYSNYGPVHSHSLGICMGTILKMTTVQARLQGSF